MPEMRQMKLKEVWSDGCGTMAILREDGEYNIYMDPSLIVVDREGVLSNFPKIRTQINQSLLSILNAKRAQK